MLKILQARLQQDVNPELPDVQTGFRKSRGTRNQIANIQWIIEKAREFQENIYFCIIDHTKAFDCVDSNKLWKILKEIEYQTTLPVSWEICVQVKKQVRTGHGTIDCVRIGKGVYWGFILSLCVLNFYVGCIMRNARQDESQAGIKIARRNINSFRYADDTILVTESKEELKSLWVKVKEESEKTGLKLNIQKTKIMTSGSITSWQIDR